MRYINNSMSNAMRILDSAEIGEYAADNYTVVFLRDKKSHYLCLYDAGGVAIDGDRVFATKFGGNSRWIAIDGEKNYYYGRYVYTQHTQGEYQIPSNDGRMYIFDNMVDEIYVRLPVADAGTEVDVCILQNSGYDYGIGSDISDYIFTAEPNVVYSFISTGGGYYNFRTHNLTSRATGFHGIKIEYEDAPNSALAVRGRVIMRPIYYSSVTVIDLSEVLHVFRYPSQTDVTLNSGERGQIIYMINAGNDKVRVHGTINGTVGIVDISQNTTLTLIYEDNIGSWFTV